MNAECRADLDSPCDCPACKLWEQESMADALATWNQKKAMPEAEECDCGGTFDEYERCSDCDEGHGDCDASECFQCFERAMGRAEAAWEGMER